MKKEHERKEQSAPVSILFNPSRSWWQKEKSGSRMSCYCLFATAFSKFKRWHFAWAACYSLLEKVCFRKKNGSHGCSRCDRWCIWKAASFRKRLYSSKQSSMSRSMCVHDLEKSKCRARDEQINGGVVALHNAISLARGVYFLAVVFRPSYLWLMYIFWETDNWGDRLMLLTWSVQRIQVVIRPVGVPVKVKKLKVVCIFLYIF